MFGNWTFSRRLGVGFAVACVALVVVAVMSYRSIVALVANHEWVTHTFEVRRELAHLASLLTDAETGERGYILTADERYLEPYKAALPAIEASFGHLKTLIRDNPEQQRRLDALRPVVEARLAKLKTFLGARKTQSLEAVATGLAAGGGQDLMDRVRALIDELEAAEAALLDSREAAATASTSATMAVLVWGTLGALVAVSLIGWFITRSLSEQIGLAVRHVQTSSAELQSAATQQAAGARQQASAMTEISTTISELLATSRQIAESAQRVSSIADQTATIARSGDATVGRGNESVSAIRRQVDLVVTSMLELGKKSQQVGSVLDIVSELAEQTNILAINATIEAAGAGEAGRRFAVVADEIRKLADRVTGSTKEIRALVDDVRGAVNATVMTTETGSKAVDAGARQFSEVASTFEQIGGRVATAADAAKEIELSTKQQATAVEQVTIAVTNVAQASRESEASTEQTLQTAAELAGLSRDLLRIIQPQASA